MRIPAPESVVGAALLGLGAVVAGVFAAAGAPCGAPLAFVLGIAAGAALGKTLPAADLPRAVAWSWALGVPAASVAGLPFLALAGREGSPPRSALVPAIAAALVLAAAAVPFGGAWLLAEQGRRPEVPAGGVAPRVAVTGVAVLASALLAGSAWSGSLALLRLAAVVPLALPVLLSPPLTGPRPHRRLRWADLASGACGVAALTLGFGGAASGARPGHPMPLVPLSVLLPAVLALSLVGAAIGRWSDAPDAASGGSGSR